MPYDLFMKMPSPLREVVYVYQILRDVPEHLETWLYPPEARLLEEIASSAGLSSEQALKEITIRQALKGGSEERSLIQRIKNHRRGHLNGSVIISTAYSPEECRLLADYRRRHPYIRTAFAVPRHALISELRDRRLISAQTMLPGGFGKPIIG